ncbi:hypothetical protein SAMN05660463_00910 [Pseudomonas sp. URIL14HWK12:I9]|nr:hypothetical protein F474_00494 [Pseudomonas sp. URIL14HWK12:I12]PVZ26969.1 hypothetical protein F470_00149 [Pseudomonas sp. URIL14HWK12:I10]PVZ37858.1 hypothetical protein F472_00494 [Pseudomonas sp. URIL14HWK12:I11]SNZ05386.1 hypothetical protein SAMN05660463_00910 [Pseudomonas sp. URIL14HWK12:I9]
MPTPSISDIENAFIPAKEISDSAKFAGRESAIEDVFYALLAEGSNIAIVGNRGIGKTSLARQVVAIGSGDNSILEKVGVKHDQKLDFLTIYFACGNSIKSTDQLLETLLTSASCLGRWIYDIPQASKVMESYSPKFSAKILGVGGELGGVKANENTSSPALTNHSVDVVFSNVVGAIVEAGVAKNGILILIDEFDQIANPDGFASFIKALATNCPQVKFCIVGVAKDIQSLMREHESTDRLFAGSIVSLDPMNEKELQEIIDNAEASIQNHIAFDFGARKRIIGLAQGHPYMVHLIGKFALRESYKAQRYLISLEDINATLAGIAEKKVDPVLEGKYRRAVGSSSQRETVLKAMAGARDEANEIFTTNAYKAALDMGVDNASQYVGQLVTDEYGAEIEKIRERFYRFKDSLFHSYIMARPRMYRPGDA